MIGEIKIKIPYPVRFGFLTVSVGRRIGFSFDQRSLYNLIENNHIDLDHYKDWMSKTSNGVIIGEMIFAAACSYAEKHTLRKWFKKEKLLKAFIELSESEQSKILETWRKSETFGYKELPTTSKKKATTVNR